MDDTPRPQSDEHAFEFPLDDVPEREPVYEDSVTEFFRQQLLNLLDVIVPTINGRPVKVDGFAFHWDTTDVFPIHADGREPEG